MVAKTAEAARYRQEVRKWMTDHNKKGRLCLEISIKNFFAIIEEIPNF